MNRSMIRYVFGSIMLLEGVLLLLPVIISFIYREPEGVIYLAVGAVCIILGLVIRAFKFTNKNFFTKDGFVCVSLCWLALSLVGAVPFVLTGEIPSYVDAVFETISGFTTTGATILTDVEFLSKTSAFWRCFTHWIGGMG
ncbi:MAG: TrkH family potassium uptake protein, partial [Lachnospiraceae bacterium]|nr:TrkH family potassium uptake protein [Lachnospiraceae bacterium]